ncbi:reverse transcriptase domain-containing protein [Tanacetum coccineum]
MKNPKLCLRHEQLKIYLLIKIHEQYSTADSGIDVTGLDATWTHNIATKETFEGNKNGTLPSVSLTKEDTSKVLVWIKMHDVPLAAYTSDGLSMIVTKLCKPMMLDSYTNTIKETNCIEYEWKPPRCTTCMIFGNSNDECPKVVRAEKVVEQNVDQDGFRVVKRGTKGNNNRSFGKTQSRFEYQPKLNRSNNDGASTSTNTNATKKNDGTFIVNIPTSNPYAALGAEYEHNKDKGNRAGFREGISLMNGGTRIRMIK